MIFLRRHAATLALSTTCAVAGNAVAGGFAIGTQSGSGTGNAYAGGAASAEDASVVWYNPAAMTALPSGKHASAALHAVKTSFKFRNSGSTLSAGTGEGGDGGDWAYIPNAYFAMDLGRGWHAGVAVNAPFGLATHYEAGWRGQLTALKSEIKSLNINPAIAYKISDMLSIGAGVSVQKLQAELSSFSGAAALGNVKLKADDIGFGFNAGVLFQATPSTRLGVSYRSKIKYELEGDARFSAPAGAPFDGAISANLSVPETLSFSAFHALNQKWELMADITRTGWDRVQQLVVVRTTSSAGGAAGSAFTTLPFEWKDTWRFGVGANYKVSDALKLRFGLAYDETPTNDRHRTARLPDQDRTWVAAGFQYKLSKSGMLEVGYAHEFLRDASVDNTTLGGRLVGRFENKADIFSVQFSHSF